MGSATPYRLAVATEGPLRAAARELEGRGHEFDHRDASSFFVVATDWGGTVAGAVRVILPGPADLPAQRGLPGPDPARTWEIASCTVRPGSDAQTVGALCHGVLQALRANRVRAVVGTFDAPVRHLLSGIGLFFTPLAADDGNRVWARVSELLDVQRKVNPEGYRLVTCGVGLVDVLLPEWAELIVSVPRRVALAAAAVQELAPSA